MERRPAAGGFDQAGSPAHVLVVEDDVAVRQSIEWALEDEGLTVETATDGGQAIERFKYARPALVILDMRLPVVDGYGVADQLRDAYGDTVPILMITADGRAAEKARRIGTRHYLHKPFDIDVLIATVRRALATGS